MIAMECMDTTQVQPRGKRRPLFTILSLLSPFVGSALFVTIAPLSGSDADVPRLMAGLASALGFLILGSISAIVALFRHERYWVLLWLGLLLNAGPIFYFWPRLF
jgi:hypothetical protein